MSGFQPKYLLLHDYGQMPEGFKPGQTLGFNPYHAVVAGGKLQYRYPDNPYGRTAPHAYNLNPQSIGLSWGGPVGGTPSAADLALLKAEYDNILRQFPGIKVLSHGEAFEKRKEGLPRASKLGRGLEEASWRKFLRDGVPFPGDLASEPSLVGGPTLVREGATPVGMRGITQGHPAAARPSLAMNGGSAGVDPLGGAGSPSGGQRTNFGRQSTNTETHPTTMVGAPSGAMLTNFGRGSAPGSSLSQGAPATPEPGGGGGGSGGMMEVGTSGPTWSEMMHQQMMTGTPALQGTLDAAGQQKINKSTPQYQNALHNALGGLF